MRSLSDYGLMKFRASAIYFMIIQGFGYLLNLNYNATALFVVSTAGVLLFNLWALLDSRFNLPGLLSGCGPCGFMDEREMDLATTAAAYGFIAAIFTVSLDQGQIMTVTLDRVGQAGFAVFLAVFLGKSLWHRFGGMGR